MTFSLHEATVDDVEGATDVWFHAFKSAPVRAICPDNPSGQTWITLSWTKCLAATTPNNRASFPVVKDDSSGKIVAFARYYKWDEKWSDDWKERYEVQLAEGVSDEMFWEGFLAPMARQHRVAMGKRPHFFLEVLATHEDYQKKGLGAMLLSYGGKKADEAGMESYLDAASTAQGLYEKFGYVKQDCQDEKARSIPMLRAPKRSS